MTIAEIPLSADNQTFFIQLGGQTLRLQVVWRSEAGWLLDLYNSEGEALIFGIPLVYGVDLLAPYRHLNFGGQLWLFADDPAENAPAISTLGSDSHLCFVTQDMSREAV